MSTNKKTLIDGDFQVGSSNFVVDTENDYVGFNNATPQNKIDVQIGARTGTHSTGKPLYVTGVTSTTGAEFVSDDGTAGIGIGSSNIFATKTNQNITITPDGIGSLGIKTATPNPSGETFDLWVQGDTKVTGNVTAGYIFGDGSALTNITGTQWDSSSEDIYFLNNTGSGSGRVAIGTSTPVSLLTLEGASGGAPPTTGQEGTSNALVRVRDDNNVTLDIGTSSGTSWLQSSDATAMGTNYSISINPNGGNVGVGTISPNVPLEVNKTAGGEMFRLATSTGTLYAGADADPPWFGTSSDDHLRLVTNGTEKIRIENGGRVGIGTDTPSHALTVAAASGDAEVHIQAQGNDGGDAILYFNGSSTNQRKCAIISSNVAPNSWCKQDLHFCMETTDDLSDVDITDSKMVITNTGNVGIGTTTMTEKLTVNGHIDLTPAYGVDTANKSGMIIFNKPITESIDTSTDIDSIYFDDSTNTYHFTKDTTKYATGNANIQCGTITGTLSTSVTPGSYLTGSEYDGSTATTFAVDATTTNTASKIVARDGNGDIFGRYFRGENVNISHVTTTRTSDTIFYSSSDGDIKKNTASGMRSSLGLANSATITASADAGNSTIVQRSGDGYIFSNYINTTDNSVSGDVTAIMCKQNNNDYHRSATAGAVNSFLGSFTYFFRRDTSNDVDVRLTAAQGRGLRFWDSDSYKIYMSYALDGTWGGRIGNSDYNMYFRMTGGTNRGFVFLNNRTVRCHLDGNGDMYLDGGWFRTYGSRGWYNQSYGGGWFMQDTTYVRCYNNKTVYTGGAFLAGGNVTAYSDIRRKKDLLKIDNALDKVEQLTGYTYTNKKDNKRYTGLIAQDVEKVLPEAVTTESDGHLSLAYGNMVGLLVEAVKELTRKNEILEARLSVIENNK